MPLNFDKHAQKGNRFLNQLAAELGDSSDTARAGRILRAVLRTLRDHLTLEENFQLMAQLPIALKGVYVDSWSPQRVQAPKTRRTEDFVEEMIRHEGSASWRDFSGMDDGIDAARAVFRVMREYVSEGEFNDIESILPQELKQLVA